MTPGDEVEDLARRVLRESGPLAELIDLGFLLYGWNHARMRAENLRRAAVLTVLVRATGSHEAALEVAEIHERWRKEDALNSVPCPVCLGGLLRPLMDTLEMACPVSDCGFRCTAKEYAMGYLKGQRRWRLEYLDAAQSMRRRQG